MLSFFTQDSYRIIARILAVLLAIPFHEVAHGFVSDKLGDHTARDMGRLTLNPIKHIDPWGLLSMLVVGVGWAKPVPVNPNFYRNRKLGMAATAFAGPLANLVLATVTILIYKVFQYGSLMALPMEQWASMPGWVEAVSTVIFYFASVNITLALFNLIPIPPLDGSRILGLVLPEKWYFGIMKYERYIMIALLAAIVVLPRLTGFSPIGWLLGGATDAVFDAIWWLTGFVDVLFRRIMGF